MKVSVIVPVYNAKNWIERCIQSIISQSYKNIEIILINDGSTDNSGAILEYFSAQDSRIIYINKNNTGTFETRKEGIKSSTGAVILNVDADDFLEFNTIELLVRKMEETGADVVIGNHYQLKCGKKKLIENKLPDNPIKIELIRSLLNNEIKGYIWGKLFKRDLLKDMDYEVPPLLQEDVLANLHIFLKKEVKVALQPLPVYNYVIHKHSANSSKNPEFVENVYKFLSIIEQLLDKASYLEDLEKNLKLFNCRNWIVYSRMGGKLAQNKTFRHQFYKENYTRNSFLNLPLHQNLELIAYGYNYHFGRFATNSLKKIENFIY